ncbi:unnamed protein product [Rotaria sordida]|uniref:Uncharacterized protein n=1 Tax=Rotaria sordida TaxID=392033 RepID=A0A815I8H5_9BILA|nr:unnamed protein product [Rotaria sordida]
MELSNELCIPNRCLIESTNKCNCSQEKISIYHLKEDSDQCKDESLCIKNDIDQVSDRLNKFQINETKFVKNLEEWRNQAHEIINKYCKLKYDQYIEIIKEEINQSEEFVYSLTCDCDASKDYIDWVKYRIQSINQQLDQFKEFNSKYSPLKIDNSIIDIPDGISHIEKNLSPLKDLFSSSSTNCQTSYILSSSNIIKNQSENESRFYLKSAKQSIKFQYDNWYSLSINETYLLLSEKSNLYLIDKSFKIVKKKSFFQIGIKDICWSKILSRFILISPINIYTLDQKLTSLELSSINLINNYRWEHGTCSDRSLFISTFGEYPFIIEYYLLPSIQLNRRWQTSFICQHNQIINDIKSNYLYLGLIIHNDIINKSRLELRSIESFQSIYSIYLGQGWSYRCSPYNNSDWIVVDGYNNRFLKISNSGIIDKTIFYPTKPFNIVDWGQDKIAIRTSEHLYIHDCE